jgi:DNA-binding response OmpR family regulator
VDTTILLVDDDELFRRLVTRSLERLGYRMLSAPDALAAIQLAEAQAPDLLIADVVLPGQDGVALSRDLRLTYPELPVLLISGHAPAEMKRFGDAPDGARFLMKPFNASALSAEIDALLAASVTR